MPPTKNYRELHERVVTRRNAMTDRINEALTEWKAVLGPNLQLLPESTQRVVAAAEAYVAEWEPCPTCNGSGVRDSALLRLAGMPAPCPDCVDGMTPSPELVERVAAAMQPGPLGYVSMPAVEAARLGLLASRQGDTHP